MADNKDPQITAEDFEELKNLVKEQAARIKQLEGNDKPDTPKPQPKATTPKETFSVGKDKYKFTVPRVILPGRGTVNTKDLLKEPAILEELVSKRSGTVAKV